MGISREQVLAYRFHAQQLDRTAGHDLTDAAILDLGVQDTGTDGGLWALANRGVATTELEEPGDLVLAWTLRGAPHFYRRADVSGVAAATAPFSEADAAKRVLNAAKPLRAAGISPLQALDVVAGHLREIVTSPTVKGDLSTTLTRRLPDPYLRFCGPCDAIHSYEMPFRLAALRAGLELEPGTSPPVLRRVPRWRGLAKEVPERLDVVRGYLHLLGPATPQLVAGFLDAPVKEVQAHWPEDTVDVEVAGEPRSLLEADVQPCERATIDPGAVRLLGPHDLFLQARDRAVLVPDPKRQKQLWVVLGSPGAVVAGGEVVGTWRPRASGARLRLAVDLWTPVAEGLITEQAERLAAHRGVAFAGFTDR